MPDEINAWNFIKKIESALSSFVKRIYIIEHKMLVSASDRFKPLTFKCLPYDGSVSLATVLNWNEETKSNVLTEVYFNTGGKYNIIYIMLFYCRLVFKCTGLVAVLNFFFFFPDVTLGNSLRKEVCLKYLFEENQVHLLKNWVEINFQVTILKPLLEQADYLQKVFYKLFATWPINEDTLNFLEGVKSMESTKRYFFDACAYYGLYSSLEKMSLKSIVSRLENLSVLSQASSVLDKKTSNVTFHDLEVMIFSKCLQNCLKPVALICVKDLVTIKEQPEFRKEGYWIDTWNNFRLWGFQTIEKTKLVDLIRRSSKIYDCCPEELCFVNAAVSLVEGTVRFIYYFFSNTWLV